MAAAAVMVMVWITGGNGGKAGPGGLGAQGDPGGSNGGHDRSPGMSGTRASK